jgi:hypothetical protein
MLSNRIYRGEIVHKKEAYRGEHEPVVEEALWNEVQQVLSANRADRDAGCGATEPSLLAGLVFDAAGERLTPTHAVKKGTRYRYYVSQTLITGSANNNGKGQRIPAAGLEALVKTRLRELLADPSAMLTETQGVITDAAGQKLLIAGATEYASTWAELETDELRRFLLATVPRIQVLVDRIEVTLDTANLLLWLAPRGCEAGHVVVTDARSSPTTLIIPARLKRTGLEMRFVVEGADDREADISLTRIMVRAHAIRDRLLRDDNLSIDEVARDEDVSPSYVTRLMRLTFLAPDIVRGILTGCHPPELTARRLMADTRVPLDWDEQRSLLGFA